MLIRRTGNEPFAPPFEVRDASRGGNERLRVQGVEGRLLPRGSSQRAHAALLRRSLPDGRDQSYLLPLAPGADAGRLDPGSPSGLLLRPESAPSHHTRPTPRGRGRRAPGLRACSRGPGSHARSDALSATAFSPQGSAAAARVSGPASAGRPRGIRVSARVLV